MSLITKTEKIDYKLKNVCFDNTTLFDENGEVVDLIKELSTVFKDEYFDISVSSTNKANYDLKCFESQEYDGFEDK